MKKQIENTDKLTDKAFSRMLITSLLGILVCIVCLGSSTWAWFSDITPSSQNEIRTADGTQLSISVEVDDDGENSSEVQLENIEGGVKLTVGGTYNVTLSLPKGSSSGYCLISTDEKTYCSEYILRHDKEEPETLTFTLTVQGDQTVEITTRWGIYTNFDVGGQETLVIPPASS